MPAVQLPEPLEIETYPFVYPSVDTLVSALNREGNAIWPGCWRDSELVKTLRLAGLEAVDDFVLSEPRIIQIQTGVPTPVVSLLYMRAEEMITSKHEAQKAEIEEYEMLRAEAGRQKRLG